MTTAAAKILVLALVAATAAGFAGVAGSRVAVARNCGAVAGAGRTWQVVAAAVPCASARALVRKLLPKVPAAGAAALGIYSGLHCTALAGAGKHGITCVSTTGKLVEAIAK